MSEVLSNLSNWFNENLNPNLGYQQMKKYTHNRKTLFLLKKEYINSIFENYK